MKIKLRLNSKQHCEGVWIEMYFNLQAQNKVTLAPLQRLIKSDIPASLKSFSLEDAILKTTCKNVYAADHNTPVAFTLGNTAVNSHIWSIEKGQHFLRASKKQSRHSK